MKNVSIPDWCDWQIESAIPVFHSLCSFNSRLVRLVACIAFAPNPFNQVSILDWCDWQINSKDLYYLKKQFQFQIGAIGRKCSATVIGANRGFNSRLVRLVEKSLIWTVNPSTTFQFQIGAIGRPQRQLQPLLRVVSIPDWCDWQIRLSLQVPVSL